MNTPLESLKPILLAAGCSVIFGACLYLALDNFLPAVFILSPFFLVLALPVGLPVLICWRYKGGKAALWGAGLSAIFLLIITPLSFALYLILQLIIPAAFLAALADLRGKTSLSGEGVFISLSAILSMFALLVTITSLILAGLMSEGSYMAILINEAVREMVGFLTLMRTLPPQQISEFEMILRMDDYAVIVRMCALYSFIIGLLNFYIASRLKITAFASRRPRDHWPSDACILPRLHVALLVGAVVLSFLPVNATLQNCLDMLVMVLLLSFTLTGLAALHLLSYGKTWRPLLLILVYGGLLPLFASFILGFWGIFVSATSLLQRYKKNLNSTL